MTPSIKVNTPLPYVNWPPEKFDSYIEDRDHWISTKNIEKIDSIIDLVFKKTEGKKCIDIGFGNPLVLLRELKVFPNCIGLYLSLEKAKEKNISESMLIKGNCYQIPFEKEEFDLVSAYALLHLLPDIPAFFREAFRVLKNGGYLYTDNDKSIFTVLFLRKLKMLQYFVQGKKYKDKYEHWRNILKAQDDYHQEGIDYIFLEKALKEIGFKKVILNPGFSFNPNHEKKISFRIIKFLFKIFKLKFLHTHIQILAVK